MSTFLLSFNATTSFAGANPPTLEILIGGVVVSSVDMVLGASSYDFLLDYTGTTPSSVSLRFAGSSGDPGDTISFNSASINSTPINVATDLTSTLLSQSQSAAVNAAAELYGHTPPTLGPSDIDGTGGDDVGNLIGTNNAEGIDGLAGNDYITARGGDDEINGGAGDDYIFGEGGNDTILAGDGNDVVFGNDGDDVIFGEADSDYLIGGAGSDLLNGGAGDDGLIGDAGDDVLFGEGGNDYLVGDAGADLLFGDDGNDILIGGDGNDSMAGGIGDDQLIGGIGDDLMSGGGGADEIIGEDGDDEIIGGAGNDSIYGGIGNDIIDGQGDNDTIYGDVADVTAVMEAGSLSVTQANATQWHSVSFTENLTNAVVKMFGADVNGDAFTIRVRDITSTGFEFQLDEFDNQDGATALEGISWIAVASGSHTLSNGTQIQAGFTTATNETAGAVSFVDTSYSSPIVFSQVSSDNNLSAVVTRNDNVSSTGFTLQMQEGEAADGVHPTEDIGWIAIEGGGSVASGILSGSTGDVVTHNTTTVNFGAAFSSAPVFVADMQTLDGGDAGYAAGASSVTTTQAQVFIDEETSGDAETSHTTEEVGYIALESGVYTAVAEINGSDTILGGDGDDILYADAVEDGIVATPSAANPLANLILADGAIGYWNLNDSAGTTADNLGSEGSSIDGSINGGATLGAGSLYLGGGDSIEFDGVNDGIRIPDSAAINTSTYTEKTVELVFNADDVTTRQVLYEEGGGTHGLTIYLDGGDVYVTGEHDGQWVDANINSSSLLPSLSTGTTYHVAFVFDQPNNSFEGFLDGVSMGSVTVNNAIFPSHGGDIGIGYAPDGVQFHDGESGGGFNFDGRISDVGIYTTALSAAQIQAHSDVVQGILPPAAAIDDTLAGGDGFDQLYGGAGRDVFIFEAVSAFNDVDQINAFDVGEQDAIDISDILTGYTAGVSDINDFVSVTTVGANSIVAVDANGATGGASFSNIAQINNFTGVDAEALLINNSIIPI